MEQVQERLKIFGYNKLEEKKVSSSCELVSCSTGLRCRESCSILRMLGAFQRGHVRSGWRHRSTFWMLDVKKAASSSVGSA